MKCSWFYTEMYWWQVDITPCQLPAYYELQRRKLLFAGQLV